MTAELRTDLTTAEYHAIDAASSSQLWMLYNETPHAMINKDWSKPTEAMIAGTYTDREVLHGDGDDYVVVRPPGINGKTNAGKQQLALLQLEADQRGVPFLKDRPNWMDAMANIKRAVFSHPVMGQLFAPGNGLVHPVVLWTDDKTGLACKAEIDLVAPYDGDNRDSIIDLKKCADIGPRAMHRQVRSLGYYFKMAWYEHAWQQVKPGAQRRCILACVDGGNYDCAIRELDLFYIQAGQRQFREALDTYATCKKTNRWPGYDYEMLEAPEYLIPELEF